MLKFFRKYARGWFMLAVIAVIIIVFVLYFGTDRGSQTASVIAIVDGRTIVEADVREEYERLLNVARQRYGAELTPEMLKQMDLKQKAYDDLIDRHVIMSKASDLKLQVSDEDLVRSITSIPEFQTDGMFDERKYRQMLRYNRVSAEDFEALQRINLMANRIEMIVREGVKVSEREAFDLFVLQNQEVNVNFVRVSAKDMRHRVNPSAEQLKSYLSSNSSLFRRPEQFKIKYLYFSAAAFAPERISDDEIRDYYNLHRNIYLGKDGRQLSFSEARSRVLRDMKLSRGMHKAHSGAREARNTIYQEDNFDQYAADNKLNVQTTGFFFVNAPPKEFATVKGLAAELMSLRHGDISKVLATENGYYLLQVVDKKEAYLPELKDVYAEVRRSFIEAEMQSLAAREAQDILERAKAGEQFEKVIREKGLRVEETGFFLPGDVIPKIGLVEGDVETLIQLSAGNPFPEKPLVVDDAYIILKFKEASGINRKNFEEAKEVYKRILLSVKQEEAMRSWLEGNREALIKKKRIDIKKLPQEL
ncbi:MAG TPA: hypothetical protein ENN23_09385 [Deltaproteobacteria bacterium]|nr:hypothetical protein [Deltaproteobacteria bacterium]